jgi:hypothetical protein
MSFNAIALTFCMFCAAVNLLVFENPAMAAVAALAGCINIPAIIAQRR